MNKPFIQDEIGCLDSMDNVICPMCEQEIPLHKFDDHKCKRPCTHCKSLISESEYSYYDGLCDECYGEIEERLP